MDQRLAVGTRRGSGEIGAPEPVRIRLLGGFGISVGTRNIEGGEWRLKKAGSLVKLLALAKGHRLHRERITDLLWPDLDEKPAANNFHRVLHFARGVLGSTPANTASRYLALQGDMLALCPDGPLWVDVETFEGAAATARHVREPAAYRAAVELYVGDLLPEDRYEEWAEARLEDLKETYLALLTELAGLYEEREDYVPAIEALRRALAGEPAREEALRGLTRLYALAGERGPATRAHSPPASPPPQPSPGVTGRHNLPRARTSFVGREREIVEVKRSLAMTQLLTLTGAGGCGKTRLALEVARDLVGAYPDGVWMARLAPISDGSLVPRTVARTLGLREQPGLSLTQTISNYLESRQTLLILDNCEHVIDDAARLSDSLLGSCESLRVLATSREALGVAGEVVWKVSTLTSPEEGGSLEDISRYEAVRLFVDRARSKLPAFELTEGNARAVAEVCRKLDGIPLAIELATARVAALAVEQVAHRLNDALNLLALGDRTAEPRHRTMRATLQWSHDLLGESERALFRRLSVFAGGWTLEAAEATGEEGAEDDETGVRVSNPPLLDLLEELVDKSLVVAEARAEGPFRYRMMEPVRQYARERLEESGETEPVRDRHARHYLALAEAAEPELRGPRQVAWLERLDIELDNLRAALSWSLEEADGGERAESGLGAVAALWRFWDMHGSGEGRAWLEAGLERVQIGSSAVRAKALAGLGWIMLFQGDYEMAVAALEEAMELYKDLGDLSGEAITLMHLGYAVAHAGDVARFPALCEECEALLQKPLDRRATAYLLFFLGAVALEAGDHERAAAVLEEGRASFRELGDLRDESMCGFTLGMTELKQGNLERGTAALEEGLSLARRTKDKLGSAYFLWGLGGVTAERGQPVRAARLWGAAEASREVIGLPLSYFDLAHSGYEARLAAARSQLEEAAWEAAWEEGRAMSPEQAIEYALGTEDPVPRAASTPRPAPDVLTRRQREVAVLIGRGFSNRRIAAELGITERTVETHAGKILRKLSFRSRTHIATWMIEQGLLPGDPG